MLFVLYVLTARYKKESVLLSLYSSCTTRGHSISNASPFSGLSRTAERDATVSSLG